MFVNIAFVSPKLGTEGDMIERMKQFSRSFENASGLLHVHVLVEKGGTNLLGISMWKDEESFSRAMENAGPP
jgi:heme-degrading monooxygenase HmoA